MSTGSAVFQSQLARVQRIWRKWRRVHAARSVSERRLLVVGAVAVTWFLCDMLFLTPSMARFKATSDRYSKASSELKLKQDEQRRIQADMLAITSQLKGDVERLRVDVAKIGRAHV